MRLLYFKTKKNQENMSLKDILKKDFWNSNKLITKRFKSSKLLFIVMWLLFFLDYFLFSNFPDNNFLINILPILYVWFIVSLLLITYYSIKTKFWEKINKIISIIILILLFIILLIFSIPFLVDSKTLSNII